MHLIYLDESGNTGASRDPQQPIHLLAALIVHESAVRHIEDADEQIVSRHFWDYWLLDGFELHAAEMFSGKGYFRNYAPSVRIQAITEVLDVLVAHGAKVIFCAIDKIRNPSSRHPHQMAFQFIVERIEDHLARENSLGLLIADENKELEQKIIEDLTGYKRTSTGWGYRPTSIVRIIDSVHFVQSKNNRLIQCVDLVAYFSLRGYRENLRVPQLWLSQPEPRPDFQMFLKANRTKSQEAVLQLDQGIKPMVVNWKIYPI